MKKTAKILLSVGSIMLTIGLILVVSVVYAESSSKPLDLFAGQNGLYSSDFNPVSATINPSGSQIFTNVLYDTNGIPVGSGVAIFTWYIDSQQVASGWGLDSYTASGSNLNAGDHSVTCQISIQDSAQNDFITTYAILTVTGTGTTSTPTPNPSITPTPTANPSATPTHNPFPTPTPTNPISIIVPPDTTDRTLMLVLGAMLTVFGSTFLFLSRKI